MDKYANPALDQLQLTISESLSFSEEALYTPAQGDCICTFDVVYKDDKATVACDVSYYGIADKHSLKVATFGSSGEYVPGYFSFYEGPPVLKMLEQLATEDIVPALIIVDGHGLAHPRKFGLACFVGAKTGIPAIGVAKRSLLKFNGAIAPERGATASIMLEGEEVGYALRTQTNVNPIFVSAGNRITLPAAAGIILSLSTEFRIPEPLRRADQGSKG